MDDRCRVERLANRSMSRETRPLASDRDEFDGSDLVLGPPVHTTSSRSTLVIIVISAGVALVGGALTTRVRLGVMAVVFGGEGGTGGVGYLRVLGIGTVTLVGPVLYLRAGLRMIRQHHPLGRRTRPVLTLPLAPVLVVVLFDV
jgi:hypothetical protein